MPAHHGSQLFHGCAGSHGLWGARQLQGTLSVEECIRRPLARQAIPVAAMAQVQAVAALGVVGEGETVLMMQAQATGAASMCCMDCPLPCAGASPCTACCVQWEAQGRHLGRVGGQVCSRLAVCIQGRH